MLNDVAEPILSNQLQTISFAQQIQTLTFDPVYNEKNCYGVVINSYFLFTFLSDGT